MVNIPVLQISKIPRFTSYGWGIVVLSALAMVATLPGRTHGLGMITERLLADPTLELDRQSFGLVNFWATMIGSLFCIPAGWMLDRWGARKTLVLVVGLLGLVVMTMSSAAGFLPFAMLITCTRGLGQSALSVISISMTGKWFRTQLPLATGVYSILVSLGFAAAFILARGQRDVDWRVLWSGFGAILLLFLCPLFALFVRSAPSDLAAPSAIPNPLNENDYSLHQALATPAFWAFGLATSLYGLVSSGVSLFNESLLIEQGFEKTAFYDLGMMTTAIGLGSNLLTGWLAIRMRMTWLTGIAMGLLGGALLGLPSVRTYPALVTYACVMGGAGGMITVLFFTIWAKLFGSAELGRIQGVAQMMTVIASALGPMVLAEVKTRTGTYLPAIHGLGVMALILAVGINLIPQPREKPREIDAESHQGSAGNVATP
jgi:MFS family permease